MEETRNLFGPLNTQQQEALDAQRYRAELTRLKAEVAENELRIRRARIDMSILTRAAAAAGEDTAEQD